MTQESRHRPRTSGATTTSAAREAGSGDKHEQNKLGPVARPSRALRADLPALLTDAQAPLRLRSAVYHPADIMRKMQDQLARDPNTAALEVEAAACVTLLGNAFLGKQGTTHLRSLYREYYQSWTKKGSLLAAQTSGSFATELGTLGCEKLSQLFHIWAGLKQSEGLPAKCRDLQTLVAYVELVRVWESFNVKKTQADELSRLQKSPKFQAFLDANKLRGRGIKQQDQLTSFIAQQLQITNKQFTLTVSRYRPLAVLTKLLGNGILGFLPLSGLLRVFGELRGTGHDRGEVILTSAINIAKSIMPELTQLCDSVQESIIHPILATTPLPPTTGLGFLVAGNKTKFDNLSIWELVDGDNLPTNTQPRVKELGSDVVPDGDQDETPGGADSRGAPADAADRRGQGAEEAGGDAGRGPRNDNGAGNQLAYAKGADDRGRGTKGMDQEAADGAADQGANADGTDGTDGQDGGDRESAPQDGGEKEEAGRARGDGDAGGTDNEEPGTGVAEETT